MRAEHLAVLASFLNTRDHAHGPDSFDRAAGLVAWSATVGLTVARPTELDLVRARELREALRAVIADGRSDPVTGGRFAAASGDHPLRAGDPSRDEDSLLPVSPAGAQAALGRVVAAVALARADGSFNRLKLCPATGCGWAFVDNSRNRSRRWCEMGSCGNQHKVRAYRTRQRAGQPPQPRRASRRGEPPPGPRPRR